MGLWTALVILVYYLVIGAVVAILVVGIGITSNKTMSEERKFTKKDLLALFLVTLIIWPGIFISAFITWLKDKK